MTLNPDVTPLHAQRGPPPVPRPHETPRDGLPRALPPRRPGSPERGDPLACPRWPRPPRWRESDASLLHLLLIIIVISSLPSSSSSASPEAASARTCGAAQEVPMAESRRSSGQEGDAG
ncbi:unnamed protein product [Lampetra fluviatilis]